MNWKIGVCVVVGMIVGLGVDYVSAQIGCTTRIGGDLVAACLASSTLSIELAKNELAKK